MLKIFFNNQVILKIKWINILGFFNKKVTSPVNLNISLYEKLISKQFPFIKWTLGTECNLNITNHKLCDKWYSSKC